MKSFGLFTFLSCLNRSSAKYVLPFFSVIVGNRWGLIRIAGMFFILPHSVFGVFGVW
jgi:hypothetical protein